MAVRAPSINNDVSKDGALRHITWTGLLNGDSGDWVSVAEWSGKTFHVFGTFGAGGTILIEGSNDINAPSNAAGVSNWQGTALSATAASLLTARDMPLWVRPRVSAGDGTTTLSCLLLAHRQDVAMEG
jgi:hypothetical protein